MNRVAVFAVLSSLSMPALVAADGAVRVVRLKPAEREAARVAFGQTLSQPEKFQSAAVLAELTMCGPRLWVQVRKDMDLTSGKLVVAQVVFDDPKRAAAWGIVPTDRESLPDDKRGALDAVAAAPESKHRVMIDTGMIRDKNRERFSMALWEAWGKGSGAHVRVATDKELGYMWALVPYDLEEPLLVVEASGRRYLVGLDHEGRIDWVDGLPEHL